MNSKNSILNHPLALVGGGLAAGFTGGLLGAGGGIIVVWILSGLLKDQAEGKDIFACALAVMLPISAVSTIGYALGGGLPGGGELRILLPAILGGLAGGFLLDKLNTEWVSLLFTVIMVISGILMVIGR